MTEMFPGLLCFLFLIIIRPQDFVSGLKGLPLVFCVLGLLLTLWALSPVDKRFPRTPQDKYYLLFFTMIVVSTLQIGLISYTVHTGVETVKLFLIYLFIVTIVNNPERFKTATWFMVLLLTLVAGMGILQAAGLDIVGIGRVWSPIKQAWQIRGTGNFDNPNDLAYSVVFVLPFAAGLFATTRDIVLKSAAVAMFCIATACIYLSLSRGGYLAVVFCGATWIFFWVSNQTLRRGAFMVGLIGVLIAFVMQTSDYREDKSSMGRVDAWANGMSMMLHNPLLGVGKGQFIEHHERDSHSSYVRAGAELGLPGLFAFLGILYSCFKSLTRDTDNVIRGPDMKLYRVGYISFLGSFAIASVFSTRTYNILFLVVAALTAVVERHFRAARQAPAPPAPVPGNVRQVVTLTIVTVIVWKLFLIQAW